MPLSRPKNSRLAERYENPVARDKDNKLYYRFVSRPIRPRQIELRKRHEEKNMYACFLIRGPLGIALAQKTMIWKLCSTLKPGNRKEQKTMIRKLCSILKAENNKQKTNDLETMLQRFGLVWKTCFIFVFWFGLHMFGLVWKTLCFFTLWFEPHICWE